MDSVTAKVSSSADVAATPSVEDIYFLDRFDAISVAMQQNI